MDRALTRDLKTLATFIEVYCRGQHPGVPKTPVTLKTHDLAALRGRGRGRRRPLKLCADCQKLLAHAFVKRSRCPMNPKPACKHCPSHCYHPAYRAHIREVMKYSGRRLVLTGRLDYLFHLLF